MTAFDLAQKAVETGLKSNRRIEQDFARRINQFLFTSSPAHYVEEQAPAEINEADGGIDVSQYYGQSLKKKQRRAVAPEPKAPKQLEREVKDRASILKAVEKGHVFAQTVWMKKEDFVSDAKVAGFEVSKGMRWETLITKIKEQQAKADAEASEANGQ